MTIEQVDSLSHEEFIRWFGAIYEDSPWVAGRAWRQRPFRTLENLAVQLQAQVNGALYADQLALIRAHPDLGTRARVSEASASEQASAGLDRLTVEEYERLLSLNQQYKEKFAFPFIFAVKGSGKQVILAALEQRLKSTPKEELVEALRQIHRIAQFRLEEAIDSYA